MLSRKSACGDPWHTPMELQTTFVGLSHPCRTHNKNPPVLGRAFVFGGYH